MAGAALLVAGTAAALLLVGSPRRQHAAHDPVARGPSAGDPVSPMLHIFRSVGDHRAQGVERTVRASDGLLFAYTNPSADLRYLMVLAVDDTGTVRWYYPAYEEVGEDPSAVPIRGNVAGVELGEEIRHALAPGALRVFALFLPRPVHVLQVEEIVAAAWVRAGRSATAMTAVPVTGARQWSRLLEVVP